MGNRNTLFLVALWKSWMVFVLVLLWDAQSPPLHQISVVQRKIRWSLPLHPLLYTVLRRREGTEVPGNPAVRSQGFYRCYRNKNIKKVKGKETHKPVNWHLVDCETLLCSLCVCVCDCDGRKHGASEMHRPTTCSASQFRIPLIVLDAI